jgi:hypothetical protein
LMGARLIIMQGTKRYSYIVTNEPLRRVGWHTFCSFVKAHTYVSQTYTTPTHPHCTNHHCAAT